MRGVPMPAKSKRWQRDRIVMGIFWTSVVAKMNLTCGGGSSSVLSRALNAARREHVDFVDDVDLVAERGWGGTGRCCAELADLVDAAVAGAVDLEHVDVVAGGDAACRCRTRRRASAVGPVDAVERLGQDAGGGGLADAAGAGEEVGVGDAIGLDGVGQGLGDRLLADEVGELLRPIAAGQDGVAFRGGRPGGSGLLGHDPCVFHLAVVMRSSILQYCAILNGD